jgi:hypothetical protein
MQLQVLAVLETGVSKLFPRASDTLRVLLILPNDAAIPRSDPEAGGPKPTPGRRRRVMASLATGGGGV